MSLAIPVEKVPHHTGAIRVMPVHTPIHMALRSPRSLLRLALAGHDTNPIRPLTERRNPPPRSHGRKLLCRIGLSFSLPLSFYLTGRHGVRGERKRRDTFHPSSKTLRLFKTRNMRRYSTRTQRRPHYGRSELNPENLAKLYAALLGFMGKVELAVGGSGGADSATDAPTPRICRGGIYYRESVLSSIPMNKILDYYSR